MNIRLILIGIALSLAALACQAVTGQPAPAPSQAPAASVPEATASPAPAASANSSVPGLVCFSGSESGLVCLGEDGWQIFTQENSPLSSKYITSLAACPNGQLVIAHYDSLDLYDGVTWKSLPAGDFNSIDALACAADGSLWVAHFEGVSHYADGRWQTISASQLASGASASSLVYDVDAAPDGRVWVTTPNSVAQLEQGRWTVFQQGQGFEDKNYFDQLALDRQGNPAVASGNGFFSRQGEAWLETPSAEYLSSIADMAFSPEGSLWLATSIQGLYRFQNGSWQHFSQQSAEVGSNQLNSLALDSQGRVWVGSDYGLSVFDGQTWRTYRMDNSPLPTNQIQALAALNAGPARLPAPEQKDPGGLEGTLKDGSGAPIANVSVEICVQNLGTQYFGDTPCSDQPFFLQTQTDADGHFVFENVPCGYYSLTAQVNGSWSQVTNSFGLSQQSLVQPGQVSDIGDITVK